MTNTFCSLAGYLEGGDSAPPSKPSPIQWRVAGQGERGEGCGGLVEYYCPNCETVHRVEHYCMSRECPSCSQIWASKEASISKNRMERAKYTFKSRLHHVILSFKEVDINGLDREAYSDFRRRCYKILAGAGVRGGGLVLHPWRESHRGEFDVGGLHCHVFATGEWLRNGENIFEDTGIIFKRIGELKYYKQYKYVFEHCGIAEGIHAITWFGNMSYRNFPKTDDEKEHRPGGRAPRCPDCMTIMEILIHTDYVEHDKILMHGSWRDYG